MRAPLAFVLVYVSFTAPWVVSDRCLASEGVFATRGGGSYSVSSTDFVSPELFRDSFGRSAWVSATSVVTVARSGGDSLWVRIFRPNGFDTDWMHVEGSYSWQPTDRGDWEIDLGQPNEAHRVPFRSVTTNPPSALVAGVRQDVLATAESFSWPRRTERVLVAPLRRAERALDKDHEEVARRSLESFMALIPSFVEEGQIPWSAGELWLNATEYILEGL
jgi:hypothetical protein